MGGGGGGRVADCLPVQTDCLLSGGVPLTTARGRSVCQPVPLSLSVELGVTERDDCR